MIFKNRQDAGRQLARKLIKYKDYRPIIVALPRGGVPVGFEIAKYLQVPLEVLVVRKIGSPESPELGIGAIAEGNILILGKFSIKEMNISEDKLEDIINIEKKELKRRVNFYRRGRPLPDMQNQTIILVDDGLARGFSARACAIAIKKNSPRRLIFASPVCAFESALELRKILDEVICIKSPIEFPAVSTWYEDFREVTDEEVVKFLKKVNISKDEFYN